jgi:hypothetical protein
MVPKTWKRFESELEGLQFPAQEAVCQIIAAHETGDSTHGAQYRERQRKGLRSIASELQRLMGALPDAARILHLCESIRLIHRPVGQPFSASEVLRYYNGGDYVSSHLEYYQRAGKADPAASLQGFAEETISVKGFLQQQIDFATSEIKRAKSPLKSSPHLGWGGGGLYYLLDRIFREGSRTFTSQAAAHQTIIRIAKKLGLGQLAYDPEKGYCPAIRNAIERMPPKYKNVCDRWIEEHLGLPTGIC